MKNFILMLIFLISINAYLIYGVEDCEKYDSIKVEGVKAKKFECSPIIQTRQGDLLKLNFTQCDSIKLKEFLHPLYTSKGEKIYPKETTLSVEGEGNMIILNKNKDYLPDVTYKPIFICSTKNNTVTKKIDDIQIEVKRVDDEEDNFEEPQELTERPITITGDNNQVTIVTNPEGPVTITQELNNGTLLREIVKGVIIGLIVNFILFIITLTYNKLRNKKKD